MAASGSISKSVNDNLALRRGRRTLFERPRGSVAREDLPKIGEVVTAQVRNRFRKQLEREKRAERRKWWWASVAGLIVLIPLFYLLDELMQLLDFWP